jgi:hypothetical protein
MYFYCIQISKMKKQPTLLVYLFFCVALFSLSACGGTDAKSNTAKKDKYEEKKESLEEIEKKNPLRFLNAIVTKDRKNLLGQTVVKGEVKNNAKIATYKDMEVKILYYSKTGVLIGESIETVYDKIAPGSSINFKSKEWAPKGTDSVALKIVQAQSEPLAK